MENPTVSSNKVAFKWSAIYVITGIVITYVIQLTNMDPNSPIKYVSYIPFIAFLLLTQKEYKDQLGGFLSFGEGFGAGFKYALYGGILMGIFTFIYLTWLNPHFLEQTLSAQQDKLQQQGLSQEQIDASVSIGTKFGPLFALVFIIIGEAIFGAIIALIGAAIFKNEKPMFTGEDYRSVEQQN